MNTLATTTARPAMIVAGGMTIGRSVATALAYGRPDPAEPRIEPNTSAGFRTRRPLNTQCNTRVGAAGRRGRTILSGGSVRIKNSHHGRGPGPDAGDGNWVRVERRRQAIDRSDTGGRYARPAPRTSKCLPAAPGHRGMNAASHARPGLHRHATDPSTYRTRR